MDSIDSLLPIRTGGIVLCGGYGRRMGRSKAWLPAGGEYLVQRMTRILGAVVRPVVVAARSGQDLPALPEDVTVVHDVSDDCGPLAGISAGFAALCGRCDAAFVASCDHPLLRPAVIRRLIDLCGDGAAGIVSHEGHTYPLLAVYRLSTHQILTDMLSRGQLRACDFAENCNARVVSSADLIDIDPSLDSLHNVNDPAAYEEMLRVLDEHESPKG